MERQTAWWWGGMRGTGRVRRIVMVLAVVGLGLLARAPAGLAADGPAGGWSERVLGNPDAPVTLTEFSSLTCPHCARFHAETLAQIKTNFIDTGKVKLVYWDFPLDRVAVQAATLARCVPPERYFAMLEMMFANQASWSRAKDPVAALRKYTRLVGLEDAAADACLADQSLLMTLLQRVQEAQARFGIESTPTFIINNDKNKRIDGARPYADFAASLTGAGAQ